MQGRPILLVFLFFLGVCICRETSAEGSGLTFLTSVDVVYESQSYQPFDRWTCGWSPLPPQTGYQGAPSPKSYATRWDPPFVPFERIGGEELINIYRDPNGFSFSADPFTPMISSWAGGKNWPSFTSFSSFITNRGIASAFGIAFAFPDKPNDLGPLPSYGKIIPLCSAQMSPIIEGTSGTSSILTCSLLFIFVFQLFVFLI